LLKFRTFKIQDGGQLLKIEQVAQLSQRDRATPLVSWNLVSCSTTVRKITFD